MQISEKTNVANPLAFLTKVKDVHLRLRYSKIKITRGGKS
jgi:hypothetical protein